MTSLTLSDLEDAGCIELPYWANHEDWFQRHWESDPAEIFNSLATAHGRNDGPWLLDLWQEAGVLDRETLAAVLAGVWCLAEYPERVLSRRLWVAMFRSAAYPPPSQPMRLYRGASSRNRKGMAWTTDRHQAQWFAERFVILKEAKTFVYETVVDPGAVLCLVDETCEDGGRKENEVVVDPGMLTAPILCKGPVTTATTIEEEQP